MKKLHIMFVAIAFVVCMALPSLSYAAVADGTYSIDYQVNKPNDSSASIANDYFAKPATLTVKDGQMTIELTIKNSSWVTEFNPAGGATVVSENVASDERVVQFPVDAVGVVTIPMKIDIDDIDYHHSYSVDFVFDGAGLPEATVAPQQAPPTTKEPEQQQAAEQQNDTSTATATNENAATTNATTPKAGEDPKQQEAVTSTATNTSASNEVKTPATNKEENPETSDALPLVYVALFMIAAIAFMRTTNRKAI